MNCVDVYYAGGERMETALRSIIEIALQQGIWAALFICLQMAGETSTFHRLENGVSSLWKAETIREKE